MKKSLIMVLGFCAALALSILTITTLTPQASAQPSGPAVSVLIDGLPVSFDVKPVIRNGRILVPFRAIAEALNVKVAWDGSTRTVLATDAETSIRLQIGRYTAFRNEAVLSLDVPPQLVGGRTMIPLRFFSEAFGCQVVWDDRLYGARIASSPKPMTVIGFYALGDRKTSSWTNLFGKEFPDTASGNTDLISELALGWYSLDEQGNLLTRSRTGWQRPEGWEKVLEAAATYRVGSEMVVHLTDEGSVIAKLLSDDAAMARAIADIAREAGGYQGVNINFEGLGWQDDGNRLIEVRNQFNNFIQLLSAQLKGANLTLTLTLHAPNSAYKGYDYRVLGTLADRIVVMAYDYGPTPEPVEKVLQAVEMAKADVPAGKLILGILAPSETAESIVTKVGIAKRYNLSGIAVWRLGLLPTDMWDALRSTVRVRAAQAPQ